MNARDKARVAKLRRFSDTDFAQEADRRGYSQLRPAAVALPRKLLSTWEADLRKHGMYMVEGPACDPILDVARTMVTVANWIKTFIELHDHDLASRGIESAK